MAIAFPYRFGVATSEPCADCTLPVRFEWVDGILEPVDALRDGLAVVHAPCHAARCPACGATAGVSCEHRPDDPQAA